MKRTMVEEGSWTVYIGGIYEESSDGQEVTYVKYYSAFGRRIAMRDNAGVHYIPADHLGSSTVVTSGAGAVVGTMKYYPYGAERSATGQMVTDKLFTGQQKESLTPDTLGLYDSCPEQRRRNGARFYSTLTGRFLSPDPIIAAPGDPQALNRYSYVRNNPLIFVDPSGLHVAVVCGWGQNCEGLDVGSLEEYEQWVIEYWMKYEGLSREKAEAQWKELITAADQAGANAIEILRQFHVLFINTETVKDLGTALKIVSGGIGDYIEHVEAMLSVIGLFPEGVWDVVLGFSLGGSIVAWSMEWGSDWRANAVILVDAALTDIGPHDMDARKFPWTRILTLNAPGEVQGVDPGGTVIGAINVVGDCGEAMHCTMQDLAPLALSLAYILPPGPDPVLDAAIAELLGKFGFNACVAGPYSAGLCP